MIDPFPLPARLSSCLRDDELLRATRHYRRALAALRGITFENLSAATLQKLLKKLTAGLHDLEDELKRRGVDMSSDEEEHLSASSSASDSSRPARSHEATVHSHRPGN